MLVPKQAISLPVNRSQTRAILPSVIAKGLNTLRSCKDRRRIHRRLHNGYSGLMCQQRMTFHQKTRLSVKHCLKLLFKSSMASGHWPSNLQSGLIWQELHIGLPPTHHIPLLNLCYVTNSFPWSLPARPQTPHPSFVLQSIESNAQCSAALEHLLLRAQAQMTEDSPSSSSSP